MVDDVHISEQRSILRFDVNSKRACITKIVDPDLKFLDPRVFLWQLSPPWGGMALGWRDRDAQKW
jgi:hypothetical protein